MPANAGAHASLIRSARARVVVFPELSLTGYELDAEPVSPGDQALMTIVEACAEANSVALVGAPVAGIDGCLHIGTLQVGPDGIEVVYRKCSLGGKESVRFTPVSHSAPVRHRAAGPTTPDTPPQNSRLQTLVDTN